MNRQEEWEVEEILDARLYYNKLQYRVKWVGQDKDLTWYPAMNFKNPPQMLQEFHTRNPRLPGPPIRLPMWLHSAISDGHPEDHPDDSRPAQKPRVT